MEAITKQNIVRALKSYCERYQSQNKAAASMKGVSSATISQMVNNKWDLITDEMWRNVASQTGYKEDSWTAVETRDFVLINNILNDAKSNSLVLAITGRAGSGKTFTLKHFAEMNQDTYVICCAEYFSKKILLSEILYKMGIENRGYSVGEMVTVIVRALKIKEHPLLIFDEADKLRDAALSLFVTLYNQLEDECGMVLCATALLEKKLMKGNGRKAGYEEIWSRIGSRCVELYGVTAADITMICEANNISDRKTLNRIIEGCDSNLRRVKRMIHAEVVKRSKTV